MHGRHWRVVDLLEHGDVASAADEIGVYERLAAEARLPAFSWYVPAWRAALAGYRGELAAARRLADEAHAQASRVRDDNADRVLGANHYTLHVVEETLKEFDLDYLRARIESPAGRSYRAYLALCLAELGDDDAARALLDEAVAEGLERMPRDANLLIGLAQLAEACAAVGHAECAAAVVPLLEPFADRMVVAVRATGARRLGRTTARPRPGGGRPNGRGDRRARGRDRGRSRARGDPVRRARPARPRRDAARPRRSRRRRAGVCAARGGGRNGGPARPRRAGPPRTRAARVRYGRASSTRLNGVSAARRTEEKPASSSTARSVASPGLRAERGRRRASVGDRVRDADQRRAGVEHPPDRVEVVLGPVARLRLHQHQRPVGRQRLADVARRRGRIAEVVERVEDADEVVALARERVGARHLEAHPLRDARLGGRLAGRARSRPHASRSPRMSRRGRPRP